MLREYLTNKYVLGAIGFLIVLSVACVLWYHYDTAHYKQQLAKEEQMLRQRETAQKAETNTETKQTTDQTSAESNTATADKSIIQTIDSKEKDRQTADLTGQTQAIEKAEEVRVSPYGFGPYPDLPPGFPDDYWDTRIGNKDSELLGRVRIKLIEQGKNITGTTMLNGLVYPTFPGTIYVEWLWDEEKKERYVGLLMGDPFTINNIPGHLPGRRLREKDIPVGIEVINYLNGGIDPYQFLGLKE